ncbi:MAG: GntR family transcriptional regulator [Candidatus Aminicenantes bacterium]|nr:MAG: GntR family transcriptional regulator [Candidatus Aminicenantes bacterium]
MIKVDTSSFIPIYEQIKKEFKKEIFRGDLKPNDLLPSIRDLATELLINPNTVARAYRELEMEGFIYTRKGKGCYVSDDSTRLMKEERKSILIQTFDEVIEEAKKYGLGREEIKRLFEERLNTPPEIIGKGE